jgi:outer membrane protein TolC
MFKNQRRQCRILGIALFLGAALATPGQSTRPDPLTYSVATPRPINPAESTTNPSAQATQAQNPYLGSVPEKVTSTTIRLSMRDAIERGLRYNLGLIESNQASADVRAGRLRALAALLPQVSAEGRQAFQNISLKEIGLKLPPIPGFPGLPATTGGFGYQDVRVSLTQSLYSTELREQHEARKSAEKASKLSIKDSRDVVVFVVGTAYAQTVASAARVETAKAQLASAQELDRQTANRFKSEVSPEIDALRAQVELQSAEQRLTTSANQFEKDKLTLARITGLAIDQRFVVTDTLSDRPLTAMTEQSVTENAFRSRSDLASAEASVRAAALSLQAEKAERFPTVSLHVEYGSGGTNVGNFNQLYSIGASVSVPLYTGGRIRADIQQAEADLVRRKAEYADLKGRIAYDIRTAWLDLNASNSSVKVAERNKVLADRALAQSRDRYENGVTNYLEVVQAQETVVAASEDYIESLYSFDVAKISLLRAMGASETRLQELLGGK